MSAEIVGTAFDAVQRELGCEFMDWEGWRWPNHFGNPVAEHRAVRENAGVWDESPLQKSRAPSLLPLKLTRLVPPARKAVPGADAARTASSTEAARA